MRKWIIALIVVAVLGAAGYAVYQQTQASQAPQFEIVREATVEPGRLQITVNASGSIEPEALVSLNFGTSGTVGELRVVRGQAVRAGDVLAELNSGELRLQVQQAQDALKIQELTLIQRLNQAPSPARLAAAEADIAAAEAGEIIARANLASAEAGVQQALAQKAQLQAGPTTAEIAAADAEIAARTSEVEVIQDQYDRIIQAGIGGTPEEQTRFQLSAARQALAAAQARLAGLQAGARPADLQVAEAAIASARAAVESAQGNLANASAGLARAQAAYDQLLEKPSPEEIAVLEAQVASARTNVELAQLRFDNSRLIAPLDGTIASVLIEKGEQVQPGVPALTLVNEDAFHIEVSVDEIDIDQISLGQPVEITLDAFENIGFEGTVADIAPTAAAASGVVSYLVTINITDSGETRLRPGLTANATIIVNEIDEVLLVPNWAIRFDRESGEAFVNILRGPQQVEEVRIETGLRNDLESEVLGGLAPGDRVVVTNEREAFSFFGN